MTLSEAQQQIDQWIHQYGGGYFSELTNLGILLEESGELARWMVRKYGDQSFKPGEDPAVATDEIRDELTDVLWVLICLANQMEIDLTDALQKNFTKKTGRDHSRHIR